MLSPEKFRNLVGGRRAGLAASLLRGLLRLVEFPYSWGVRWRNAHYDRDGTAIEHVPVPVVSVGNLTLGGTGKTPLVEFIAARLLSQGVRVALVSRGYRAAADGANDEARELALKLPGVPHVQNADRVAAAREAIERRAAEAIVLDDAFQHRRLGRDLDIVVIDALEPFGFDHLFPRGTLREPVSSLARADVVVLSRADMVSPDGRAAICEVVRQWAPTAIWCEACHAPRDLIGAGGERRPLAELQGQPLAAFCGIGNPAGFRHTLATCGYTVAAFREFPDHHAYPAEDIDRLAAWAKQSGAAGIVCTQKDLVKIPHATLAGVPLWAVSIGLQFTLGQSELEGALRKLVASRSTLNTMGGNRSLAG